MCARCVTGKDAKRASASMTGKVRKRIKTTPNPRARRPRAAHGQGVAARDVTPESEEDEEEGVECGKRMYGVRCLQHTLGRWDEATTRVEETITDPLFRGFGIPSRSPGPLGQRAGRDHAFPIFAGSPWRERDVARKMRHG
jgi:hypothetical protein